MSDERTKESPASSECSSSNMPERDASKIERDARYAWFSGSIDKDLIREMQRLTAEHKL